MSYIKQASYLHRRGAVYQYIRRVPCDIRPYYKTNQLYFSLRTTSPTFIESVIDGRNTVFSEQQSNERLVNGLKVFLSTLSSK